MGAAARIDRGRCLPPAQRVLTPDGYRPIAAVDARAAVVTGLGRVRWVVGVHNRQADEPLHHLRTARGNVLRATGEHPVLARRQEGLPEWVPAGALRAGDLVAIFGLTSLGGWPRGQRDPARGGPALAARTRRRISGWTGCRWRRPRPPRIAVSSMTWMSRRTTALSRKAWSSVR